MSKGFQRMNRIVRICRNLNKDVAPEIIGGYRGGQDHCGQPAEPLHLVRNAMDHGIESKEERIAAGKPEQGLSGLRPPARAAIDYG